MSKRKDGPSDAVKLRVLKRDQFRCTYCGTPGTQAELEIDHIIPASRQGSNHISNLTTACRRCNQKKSDGQAMDMPNASRPSGLVGLWLHTWNEKEQIAYQGNIIGNDGELAIVQLFNWIDGGPSKVVLIPKSDLLCEEKCTLYANADQMNWAYEQYNMRVERTEAVNAHARTGS